MRSPGGTTLQFLGAAGTVTGSKFLVAHRDTRILVDCGLYQGLRELRERNWAPLPFDPATLDAVVLTHAHIDHCGYLPRLVAEGFSGPVYTSARTAELAGIVLPDSGHLNEEEASYARRKGYSRHDPVLPLFTEDDAHAALQQLVKVDFGVMREIAPDVRIRLSRAGHILGAASVAVHVDRDEIATAVFSGDLGRDNHPFLVAPDRAPEATTVLVESTYGNRLHDDSDGPALLAAAINTTIDRGGSVIIPAFAVDRTEVLLHHLADLSAAGQIPRHLPVFVDSPMALAALRVYRDAIADGDPDIRPEIAGTDPFAVPDLHEVSDVEGSKALNRPAEPCVIISAAGMASGGRVVHHLAHLLPDSRNTVVLVGYQAAGTRGRSLVEGATELKMLGRYVRVRAQVVNLPHFSVHADAAELTRWVGSSGHEPDAVYVVHGEPDGATALAERVRRTLDWAAVVPRYAERVLLRTNSAVANH